MTFYFLFLESIGTPELVLIAFVALIVFGPRKLPSIGRQIGKYTSEFKRASNEFRRNWESEVEAAEREESLQNEIGKMAGEPSKTGFAQTFESNSAIENTIGRSSARRAATDENSFANLNENDSIALPEIRAVSQTDFAPTNSAAPEIATQITAPQSKREWL